MEETIRWQKQVWQCSLCGFKTTSLLEKDTHIQKTRNDKYHRRIGDMEIGKSLEECPWRMK